MFKIVKTKTIKNIYILKCFLIGIKFINLKVVNFLTKQRQLIIYSYGYDRRFHNSTMRLKKEN